MFIKSGYNKIVNLDNVSNIFIDHNDMLNKGKVIFNMNYSVKIFGDKFTPDYVYFNYNNKEELEKIKTDLFDKLNKMDCWIFPFEEGQRYVNIKCISSIGTDIHKNRVIFNLNYNVTHPKDYNRLTSDFVFFNFSDEKKYDTFLNSLAQL